MAVSPSVVKYDRVMGLESLFVSNIVISRNVRCAVVMPEACNTLPLVSPKLSFPQQFIWYGHPAQSP